MCVYQYVHLTQKRRFRWCFKGASAEYLYKPQGKRRTKREFRTGFHVSAFNACARMSFVKFLDYSYHS